MTETIISIMHLCKAQGRNVIAITIPFSWYMRLVNELFEGVGSAPDSFRFRGIIIHKGWQSINIDCATEEPASVDVGIAEEE